MSDTLVKELEGLAKGIEVVDSGVSELSEGSFSELQTLMSQTARKKKNRMYQKKVQEAAQLFRTAVQHPYGHIMLREALKVSDFPTYFGDILDRMVLARFSEWIPPFGSFMKQGTFRDLTRTSRQTQFRGGSEAIEQVGEFGPYPERGTTPTHYGWAGSKYGADFRISWETLLADDLGGLTDLPSVLASAARVAETKFATALYVDSTGPHASLYTAANTVASNPALDIASLEAAVTLMRSQVDPVTGNPILNGPAFLVVPPALQFAAMKILGSTNVIMLDDGTATQAVPTVNAVASLGITLVVDPFIPIIATTNGDTSWFLFSNPNSGPLGPGLAAVQFDRLVGMGAPLLLQKRSDFTTIGGGADPRGPLDEVDSVTYRVVHAFGGGQLFLQATVASDGSGT